MAMSDLQTPPAARETCAQCTKTLEPGDRVASGDRVFCRSCYLGLRAELEQTVTQMSSDVPYPMATLGAVLGGAAGVAAWWAFTVATKVAFGLIAVAIGFLVGLGTVKFAGGKRSAGLQAISVVVALVSFLVATYLVNMTFINRQLADSHDLLRLTFPPHSITMFFKVISAGFGVMDCVFLAIVLYEAWKIPRPLRLPPNPSA
jgi:hypothetical protein